MTIRQSNVVSITESTNQLSQSTNQILMIRPHQFRVNQQTMADNAFQNVYEMDEATLEKRAYMEVTQAVAVLRGFVA